MGVSGCGKTTVGQALEARCGIAFIDGDALHPKTNIDKMASGQPLDDTDRAPWLAAVGRSLAATDGPVVIGCSALKRIYRDTIRDNAGEPVFFLHLDAPRAVLARRVETRRHHFMPASLLDSQFAALERLGTGEAGCAIDISQSFAHVVAQAETCIKETSA